MLNKLNDLPNFKAIIYRDDYLAITSSSPRIHEITIEINLTRVDFLDVTLDLETSLFKPYRKPGDRPLYVSAYSNHPPQVLKNIPAGIERRLSDNSANKQVFYEAAPVYQI